MLLVDWAEQLWSVKRRRRDIFRDTHIWCFSRQNTAIQHSSLIMTWLRYTMKNWSRLHLNHYGLWTIFASNIVSEILIFIQSLPFLKNTAQKIKFCITDFFSKWDQIRSFLRIWSHLLKKSVMANFIFCAVEAKLNSVSFNLILLNHWN